jgi:phospholipase/lecithinase/hemolysin
MPQRPRVACVALSSLLLWACSGLAQARTWTALYAFGDSYSDSGAGYVDGDGPTAVAYLASSLGIAFDSGKSINFAVSGARTGASEGVKMRPAGSPCCSGEFLIRRGMQTQVADFSRRVASGNLRFDPDTTLFFLAGGLNDRNVATETSVANLESEIRTLYGRGGRYFLVALLPRKIPEFAGVGARLDPAIARIPADLRSLPGIHIELSRWGEYFDNVIENPGRYGITNVTDKCAGRATDGEDPMPCADPDAHFYFHPGHPSTAVHRIVAREMERELAILFP